MARLRANDDASIDISDSLAILAHLFTGEARLGCEVAGDVNTDGAIDPSDPIALLDHLFLGGPAPGAPYPDCGPEAVAGPLDCAVSRRCP